MEGKTLLSYILFLQHLHLHPVSIYETALDINKKIPNIMYTSDHNNIFIT